MQGEVWSGRDNVSLRGFHLHRWSRKHLRAQNTILPLLSATPEQSREREGGTAQPSGCVTGLQSQNFSHISKYPAVFFVY